MNNNNNKFTFDGSTLTIIKITLTNFLLSIITLTIYRPFGNSKLRKYLLEHLSLDGSFLEYTGTGRELFRGKLKALAVLCVVLLIYFLIMTFALHGILATKFNLAETFAGLFFWLSILYILGFGVYAGLSYRMSKTSWRGIRGNLTGSKFSYANYFTLQVFLTIITLGIYAPYMEINLYRYRINKLYFGNLKANFNGNGHDLIRMHLLTLLLAIPTLLLSRFWYRAKMRRYLYSNTTIGKLKIENTETGSSLLLFTFKWILVIICSLGILVGLAYKMYMEYFTQHFTIIGDLNAEEIKQGAMTANKAADGLEEVLGQDVGII